ncbi:MAG: hypothetical protein ACYTKD_28555 [Planctomycetota bacterium]
MGYFLAVSAFRRVTSSDLVPHIQRYLSRHDVDSRIDGGPEADENRDALFFPSCGDWIVVLWPSYFNLHDVPLCRQVSREAACTVSTVGVYDGDYWRHGLLHEGVLVDRFASVPDYFAGTRDEAADMRARWRGDPGAVAECLGVATDVVASYFVHLGVEGVDEGAKAFPDDEFAIGNFWAFTDFWRHVGITYPEDVGSFELKVRVSKRFRRRLPIFEDGGLG